MTEPPRASRSSTRADIVLVGPGPGTRGGIAQFNRHLADALSARGLAVDVMSFHRLYPPWTRAGRQGPDPSSAPRPAAGRVTSMLVPWSPASWVRAARELRRRRPRAVLFQWWHPFFGPCYLALALVGRASGARIGIVCHNAQPHERFPLGRLITRIVLRRASSVFALSRAVAADAAALAGRSRVVESLGHPAYEELVRSAAPAREEWQQRIGKANRKMLLFFGNVRPYKGLPDLIDAFALVRSEHDALLVVAGSFFEDVEPYRAQINRLGLGDDVRLFPQYVADEEVGALLELADLVVLPYRTGTQTGVVPLAAEAGKPVVVTRVGGIAEQAGAGAHVAAPGDPADLAAAISAALSEPVRSSDAAASSWPVWAEAVAAHLLPS